MNTQEPKRPAMFPKQTVVKERRDYNQWVANETLEDYSLRYAPKSFRRWSEWLLASTALGGISFLALEAIGASLTIAYGFTNAFWAIVTVGAVVFLTGLPIAYYAAKYNIDMDLLTRGAGFGYIGSTITSLIYASFTFIFFALEATILSQALDLYLHVPLWLGYILSSVVIIPLVFYGVTAINQLQLWTQLVWLTLMLAPYGFVFVKEPDALNNLIHFSGNSPYGTAFDPVLFGMAATVSFSLIAQIGEQVDYLRFLPPLTSENRIRWWTATIAAGPGWIVLGVAKQLGGAFLASLAIHHGVEIVDAKEPIQMYLVGFLDIFSDPSVALTVSFIFVVVSQIKINVTNAYAGSLAWSNFFSRLTHTHPGRVIWLVFNVAIALVLMECGVFKTLESVLGLYSNVAIAWVGAIVADLVVNKPLKLSPSYIEFKRAYLYSLNPVGVGSTAIASLVSILAFLNVFGPYAQAYSSFLALGLAFVLAPTIAWLTKGRYYLARENVFHDDTAPHATETLLTCSVCENQYESFDMAYCPVYAGPICSLCCTLDTHCHDRCKKAPSRSVNLSIPGVLAANTLPSLAQNENRDSIPGETPPPGVPISRALLRGKFSPRLGARVLRFASTFTAIFGTTIVTVGLVYYFAVSQGDIHDPDLTGWIGEIFVILCAFLGLVAATASWWLVLSEESRELVEEELDEQNLQLQNEVQERRSAEAQLQNLTQDLENRVRERTAELSSTLLTLQEAQTQLVQTEKMSSLGQLVAGVAHEINNPVNFIHGNLTHAMEYLDDLLELLDTYEAAFPAPPEHVADLREDIDIEFLQKDLPKLLTSMSTGTNRIREIVRSLRVFSRVDEAALKAVNLHDCLDSTLTILAHRFQERGGGVGVKVVREYGELPLVECLAGQLNQVFMNLLANAVDAIEERIELAPQPERQTVPKEVTIRTVVLQENWVQIAISDTGRGIAPENLERLFDAFFTTKDVGKGTGLGLSISYQVVVEKHQGRLKCESDLGMGTTFSIELPVRCEVYQDNKENRP
ncbi:MAG: ATP-binding protein [Geitlerinemataceae cyanobacterium]